MSESRCGVRKSCFPFAKLNTYMVEKGKTVPRLSDEKCVMAALIVHVIHYLTELFMKLKGKG